ncbi:T9SS C-terminal target domain-containing protein [Aquimarina sp. BL5]|uniref:T9SS type A sorting domain-containing protein n=1 Tax=Aquimarina sp. BL5 TaxID=1714860 RepID=UPI000E525E69|nr:T9SS type A sorting domain-containing protein [Aquimarina sp. BL5]AXT50331.1 T9SS C-terminal target domain-containing protein [Aquimarina sp. BL5]RKM87677.1 T9SS C-terminal target domain-containing protein [Aquimarina sp. BL5]
MKKYLYFFSILISITSWSQDFEKITIPNFSNYVVPHFIDLDGILYCTAKLYDSNNGWQNYIAQYDIEQGSIEIVDYDFFRTPELNPLWYDSRWQSFTTFFEYGNYIYFRFESELYRKQKGTSNIETYLTNFDYSGQVGQYIIYSGATSDFSIFKIHDLETNQQIGEFTARNADEFYIHNNSIYFFAEYNTSPNADNKYNYIYKYDLATNSLSTLYSSIQGPEHAIALDQYTRMEKVGDNLVYNVRDNYNNIICISISLNNDSLNSNFTFNYGNPETLYLYYEDMFVIDGEVFFNNEESFYKSDGIQQPSPINLDFDSKSFTSLRGESNYLDYNGKVFGSYNSDDFGREMYYTDGRSSYLLKDIISGEGSGYFGSERVYNNNLFFYEFSTDSYYVSDGTTEGTEKLFTMESENFGYVQHYANKIFFFAESDTNNGLYVFEQVSLSTPDFDLSLNSVTLWLDSTNSILNYQSKQKPTKIKVFDTLGREINVGVDFNNNTININRLVGMHIIIFEFEQGKVSKKIILK